MKSLFKIALGGSCHWCTEALFQSLNGVERVEQGFVASTIENESYSEAVIVYYDEDIIKLNELIEIHLHTHKSTSKHSMRHKYRSAIYFFNKSQSEEAMVTLDILQAAFKNKIITKILPFKDFRPSDKRFHNYYYSNPEKPFCQNYITPKLQLLLSDFSSAVDTEKVSKIID